MSRITIEDLTSVEPLTPEQEELVQGAGLRPFRPTLEGLEDRQLMASHLADALPAKPPAADAVSLCQFLNAPQMNVLPASAAPRAQAGGEDKYVVEQQAKSFLKDTIIGDGILHGRFTNIWMLKNNAITTEINGQTGDKIQMTFRLEYGVETRYCSVWMVFEGRMLGGDKVYALTKAGLHEYNGSFGDRFEGVAREKFHARFGSGIHVQRYDEQKLADRVRKEAGITLYDATYLKEGRNSNWVQIAEGYFKLRRVEGMDGGGLRIELIDPHADGYGVCEKGVIIELTCDGFDAASGSYSFRCVRLDKSVWMTKDYQGSKKGECTIGGAVEGGWRAAFDSRTFIAQASSAPRATSATPTGSAVELPGTNADGQASPALAVVQQHKDNPTNGTLPSRATPPASNQPLGYVLQDSSLALTPEYALKTVGSQVKQKFGEVIGAASRANVWLIQRVTSVESKFDIISEGKRIIVGVNFTYGVGDDANKGSIGIHFTYKGEGRWQLEQVERPGGNWFGGDWTADALKARVEEVYQNFSPHGYDTETMGMLLKFRVQLILRESNLFPNEIPKFGGAEYTDRGLRVRLNLSHSSLVLNFDDRSPTGQAFDFKLQSVTCWIQINGNTWQPTSLDPNVEQILKGQDYQFGQDPSGQLMAAHLAEALPVEPPALGPAVTLSQVPAVAESGAAGMPTATHDQSYWLYMDHYVVSKKAAELFQSEVINKQVFFIRDFRLCDIKGTDVRYTDSEIVVLLDVTQGYIHKDIVRFELHFVLDSVEGNTRVYRLASKRFDCLTGQDPFSGGEREAINSMIDRAFYSGVRGGGQLAMNDPLGAVRDAVRSDSSHRGHDEQFIEGGAAIEGGANRTMLRVEVSNTQLNGQTHEKDESTQSQLDNLLREEYSAKQA